MDLTNPLLLIPALVIVVALYYAFPDQWRRYYLFFISLAFLFLATPQAGLLLVLLSLFNYGIGIFIERASRKKWVTTLSIVFNCIVFLFPRYIELTNTAALLVPINYLIPLGIAFITLQNISYLLNVSRGILPAERNLINFMLFITFFPKLTAGPIESARHFLPQVRQTHPYKAENIHQGLFLIGSGIFKKIVIADRLALITDQIFNNPGQYYGLTVLTAVFFYSFQIYFDFSGYTDIARGIAYLFGYDLSINFNKPFLAENINEFWSRWHITFTTWLRENIFFPIRRFLLRQSNNTTAFLALLIPPLITMLASGLWHGLKPTFILWGLYHGLLLFLTVLLSKNKKPQNPRNRWSRRLTTFSLVTFGWFFFRASSIPEIGIFLQSIFVKSTTFHDLLLEIDAFDLVIAFAAIPMVMGFEIYLHDSQKAWNDLPVAVRWIACLAILLSISMLGVYQPGNTEFIYAGF